MSIKISVSNKVLFKVRGTMTDEAGIARVVDFDLIARRLTMEELQAELADNDRKVTDFLYSVVTGWRRVLDDDDKEAPFSLDGLRELFRTVGLAQLAYKQYLAEVGVKEKN